MKAPILLALPALLLSACASMNAPSPDEIARLPVVSFGQPAPAAGEFVLRYPAGVDLPVTTRVVGNLFAQTDQTTLHVRLKQDVFVYRDRVSFDGKTWGDSKDKVSGHFRIGLPGARDGKIVDALSPGELAAEFNLR